MIHFDRLRASVSDQNHDVDAGEQRHCIAKRKGDIAESMATLDRVGLDVCQRLNQLIMRSGNRGTHPEVNGQLLDCRIAEVPQRVDRGRRIGSTRRHRFYTVLAVPTAPWHQAPLNTQLPWTDVLDGGLVRSGL